MKIDIKVVPGASQTKIAGWLGEALKIRVAKPAEKGKANKAVRTVLSKALNIPLSQIEITAGKTSSRKTVEIAGHSNDELLAKIAIFGFKK